MKKIGHALLALPLAGILAVAGCGGSSATLPNQQAAQSIAVGEPSPNAALATAPFVAMARAERCSGLRNRLLVIDQKQVFWDRAGNCPDNSYAQVLFGADPQTILCSVSDSIAGPRTVCSDEKYRAQFTTMLANLDAADLGLGAGHTVKALSFLPVDGSLLAFSTVEAGNASSIAKAQNVVVRDKDSWTRLWNDSHAGGSAPALPDVDFSKNMVLGVFLGEGMSGCKAANVDKVAVAGGKIVVNYDLNVSLPPGFMCIQPVSPYRLVMVERSDADVVFADVTANRLDFTTLDQRTDSTIDTPQNLVIKDATSWAVVWARHAPKDKLPEVDFSKNMVLGVFLGARSSGCYATQITSVDYSGGVINVAHRDSVPGPATMCAAVMTAPAHLIVVERSDAAVEFAAETVTLN